MKLLLSLSALAIVQARLGADDSAAAQLEKRKLEVVGNMFSDMLDEAGNVHEIISRNLPMEGDYGDKDWGDFDMGSMMGDFDLNSVMETMMNMNYTDLYDRCCPSDDDFLTNTQYDATKDKEELVDRSCKCPVRGKEALAEKWAYSCAEKVGPRAAAEIAGEPLPAFDFESMMEKFMDKMKSKNYTDIYDRCCESPEDGVMSKFDMDPANCKCPVRTNETFAEKWDDACENKLAKKAAGTYEMGEYDGSGMMDFGSMMEAYTGKSANYTAIYDNCCPTQDGLFDTAYTADSTACSCPVRSKEILATKWEDKCKEAGEKVMEGME